MYTMTKEDRKLLSGFITLSKSIDTIYSRFVNDEINGTIDLNQTQLNMRDLSIALEVERDKYQDVDPIHAASLLTVLFNQEYYNINFDEIDNVLKCESGKKYTERVSKRLYYIACKDPRFFIPPLKIEPLYKASVDKYGEIDVNDEMVKNKLINYEIITTIVRKNLILFIQFLQNKINDPKYAKFRKKFIQAKFQTAFVEEYVENYLFFHSDDLLYGLGSDTEFTLMILKVSSLVPELLNEKYAKDLYERYKAAFEKLIYDQYQNRTVFASTEIYECFNQALLMLMRQSAVNDIYYKINEGTYANPVVREYIKAVHRDVIEIKNGTRSLRIKN